MIRRSIRLAAETTLVLGVITALVPVSPAYAADASYHCGHAYWYVGLSNNVIASECTGSGTGVGVIVAESVTFIFQQPTTIFQQPTTVNSATTFECPNIRALTDPPRVVGNRCKRS